VTSSTLLIEQLAFAREARRRAQGDRAPTPELMMPEELIADDIADRRTSQPQPLPPLETPQ
jgi:hypothetical protein